MGIRAQDVNSCQLIQRWMLFIQIGKLAILTQQTILNTSKNADNVHLVDICFPMMESHVISVQLKNVNYAITHGIPQIH